MSISLEDEDEIKVDLSVKGPLLLAASKIGNESHVDELLAMGVSPEYADENNWTPLLWSSCNGYVNITAQLLLYGGGSKYLKSVQDKKKIVNDKISNVAFTVSPKKTKRGGEKRDNTPINSPLHWACYKGHEKIVWMLLKFGFSSIDIDNCGNVAIHLAAAGGHLKVLETLLSSEGAVLEVKNFYGNTSLSLATDNACRTLLQKAMKQQSCSSCKSDFSFQSARYLCTCCNDCYCNSCSVREYVVVKLNDPSQKPVRYCRICLEKIRMFESNLKKEISSTNETPFEESHLEPLKRGIEDAKRVGASVLDINEAEETYKKLVASCSLNQVIRDLQAKQPASVKEIVIPLTLSVEKAKLNGVQEELITIAENLIITAYSECKLTDALNGCDGIVLAGPSNFNQMKKLNDALVTAENANATENLIESGRSLKKRLDAEVELQALYEYGQKLEVDETFMITSYKEGEGGQMVNIDGNTASTRLELLQILNLKIDKGLEEAKYAAANTEWIEKVELLKKVLTKKQKMEETAARERRRVEEEEAAKKDKKKKAAAGKK